MNTDKYIGAFSTKSDELLFTHSLKDDIFVFMNILEQSNHIRVYLKDSLETNKLFNDKEIILKLNDLLYRPHFYVDIITTLNEKQLKKFNALVMLCHHPAYKNERLNIYDGSNVSFGDGVSGMHQMILGDYTMYFTKFNINSEEYSTACANDFTKTSSLVVQYDDMKLKLNNIF